MRSSSDNNIVVEKIETENIIGCVMQSVPSISWPSTETDRNCATSFDLTSEKNSLIVSSWHNYNTMTLVKV